MLVILFTPFKTMNAKIFSLSSGIAHHVVTLNAKRIYLRIYDFRNDDTCADKSCLLGGRRSFKQSIDRFLK